MSADQSSMLWGEFASGGWHLVARADVGERRTLLVAKDRASAPTVKRLNERELCAMQLAIMGHSTKYIAYEIGVAVSTASVLVASVIRKLGLQSRVELVEIFGPAWRVSPIDIRADTCELAELAYVRFDVPRRMLEPPSCLTLAERDVVRGVLSARSNAEIARSRRTSVRTVANQLRAVYQKLGISGRSQLLTAC